MFWMMNGMGPRGPMHGHRGFNGGFGPRVRRPVTGFGLGGLFLLPALLFGGWVIIAVLGAIIGTIVMVFGEVFGGLASAAESVFSGVSSPGAIAVGAVIGYLLYRRFRAGRAEQASAETEDAQEESAPDYYAANSLNNRNG